MFGHQPIRPATKVDAAYRQMLECRQAMKKLLFLFAILTTLFLVVGCGGDGNNDDVDPVDNFLADYQYAYEAQDLSFFGTIISPSYLQQCQDKSELLHAAADIFDDANITNITVEYRGGIQKEIDYTDGFATFSTTLRLNYDLDGTPTHQDYDFDSVLRQEGFNWKLYGDQICSGSATAAAKASPVPAPKAH